MTENLSRLHINRSGAYIGTGATTNLTALIWWIQDSRAQWLVTDPNAWNENVINNARQRMNLERQYRDSASEYIVPPKCLDQTKWMDSYLALMNYLRNRTSADWTRTIDYLVRIDKPLGWLAATRAERLLYGAALTAHILYKIIRKFTALSSNGP